MVAVFILGAISWGYLSDSNNVDNYEYFQEKCIDSAQDCTESPPDEDLHSEKFLRQLKRVRIAYA